MHHVWWCANNQKILQQEDQICWQTSRSSGLSGTYHRKCSCTYCKKWVAHYWCTSAFCQDLWLCDGMGWSKAAQLDMSLNEDLRVAKVDEGTTCKGFYLTQWPNGSCRAARIHVWAMDPEKLAAFLANKLIPAVADKYMCNITHNEMPHGLKKYMEYELFPKIHLKIGWGVSLPKASWWMHHEGFQYISHKRVFILMDKIVMLSPITKTYLL